MSTEAARSFLESITGYTDDAGGVTPSQDRPVKIGVVDLAYDGTGDPMVKFDGESIMGVRTYVALQPVAAGDRVIMLPVGSTFVILGAVTGLNLDLGDLEGVVGLAHGGTGVAAASLADLKAALGIPFAETGGVASSSGSAGGSSAPVFWDGATTIVLPVGMFSVTPNIKTDVLATGNVMWSSLRDSSATSFSVRLMRVGAAPPVAQIQWTARQGTASGVTG